MEVRGVWGGRARLCWLCWRLALFDDWGAEDGGDGEDDHRGDVAARRDGEVVAVLRVEVEAVVRAEVAGRREGAEEGGRQAWVWLLPDDAGSAQGTDLQHGLHQLRWHDCVRPAILWLDVGVA